MSNIFTNNHSHIDLKISKSNYWDLTLSKEIDPVNILDGTNFYDNNLISWIDLCDNTCVNNNKLYGKTDYFYTNGINMGLKLENIGLSGFDNGLLTFDKNNIDSDTFKNLIANSVYEVETGDTRLILHQVTGSTESYIYPSEIIDYGNCKSLKLNGGFYQGIYKTNDDDYQILPSTIYDEISFSFSIVPDFTSIDLENTLNYINPENKGIFFYMGLRSENKFWYDYNKKINENFEIKTTGNTSILNDDVVITTNNGFDVSQQGIYDIKTDNKYLIFNRTKYGITTDTFDVNAEYHITGITKNQDSNLYLSMNRTKTGYTADDIENPLIDKLQYSIYDDIFNNQIAFRVKDDGSIGYRTINSNCESGYTIDEEYSNVGVVINGEQQIITVRMIMNSNSECGGNRKYVLCFYVNDKLVLTSKELPELVFRGLNDLKEKQEGIAYNISLGGGSQGLCDMIGFSNNYSTHYLLPIEKYFSGTFIGEIKSFMIFNGKYDYSKIKNNYINSLDNNNNNNMPT